MYVIYYVYFVMVTYFYVNMCLIRFLLKLRIPEVQKVLTDRVN